MIPVLEPGDCRDVMLEMQAMGRQFDSCVTDPPYHLTSIVKRFGKPGSAPAKHGTDGVFARSSAGFMGKQWDGGDIAFQPDMWRQVFDLLKPGGYLLAFGGTRTFHRMAVAIEDAGFEIRDTVMWLYGTGFPKSHDVSKGIDKAAGAVREVVGTRRAPGMAKANVEQGAQSRTTLDFVRTSDEPATEAARQWQGWGTALKPSHEPIIVARKPLIGTVVANVLQHGTGAMNIDGCRIESGSRPLVTSDRRLEHNTYGPGLGGSKNEGATDLGRWPANVITDGSDEVLEAFAAYGEKTSGKPGVMRKGRNDGAAFGAESRPPGTPMTGFGDSGSAARFFYSAKATKADRAGSNHPTVKPQALMRYLCRLVTQPGGTVLDPFAGSGSTLAAAYAEGFASVGIEREAEYIADIEARIRGLGVSEPEPTERTMEDMLS